MRVQYVVGPLNAGPIVPAINDKTPVVGILSRAARGGRRSELPAAGPAIRTICEWQMPLESIFSGRLAPRRQIDLETVVPRPKHGKVIESQGFWLIGDKFRKQFLFSEPKRKLGRLPRFFRSPHGGKPLRRPKGPKSRWTATT